MCGRQRETRDREPPHCDCGLLMRRQWNTFAIQRASSIQPHFNRSAGAYVSSMAQLKNEFSRQSDEMSERMGFHVDYQPVDPHDLKHSKEAFGVTDEGLEHREKTLADLGDNQRKAAS